MWSPDIICCQNTASSAFLCFLNTTPKASENFPRTHHFFSRFGVAGRIGNVTEQFFGINRQFTPRVASSFGNSCRTSRQSVEIRLRVNSHGFESFAEASSRPPFFIIEVAAIGTVVRIRTSDSSPCDRETAEFHSKGRSGFFTVCQVRPASGLRVF